MTENHNCTEGRWEEYEEGEINFPAVLTNLGVVFVISLLMSISIVQEISPKSLVTLSILLKLFFLGAGCSIIGMCLANEIRVMKIKQRWVRK